MDAGGTDFLTDLRLASKLGGFEDVEPLEDAEIVRLGFVFFRPATPSATAAAKGLPAVAGTALVGFFGVVFFKPAAPKATAAIKGFPDDGVPELREDPRLVFFKPALPSDTAAANELLCPPEDDADVDDGIDAFNDPWGLRLASAAANGCTGRPEAAGVEDVEEGGRLAFLRDAKGF
jgi:hypothetical protein